MIQGLFHAHSGLRYLVLLAGLLAAALAAYRLLRGAGSEKGERIATAAFVGLMDLQLLLGLIMVLLGLYYPALIGHIVLMALAVVVAHVASARARRREDAAGAARVRLIGVAVALLLIAAGVAAIGRGLLATGAPTLS